MFRDGGGGGGTNCLGFAYDYLFSIVQLKNIEVCMAHLVGGFTFMM